VTPIKSAFQHEPIVVPIAKLLPLRSLKPGLKETSRYKTIEASVREVGIIEPLIVYPQKGKEGAYTLLDGHIRVEVLRDLGVTEAVCLIANDDEDCTYNHRVNRLAPIQENKMILKAIEAGVSEERIAKALNVSPKTIRDSKKRLDDISPEALDLLKDKPIADMALRCLKKVRPYRQVEMAECMVRANTFTTNYARALLEGTPSDQRIDVAHPMTKPEQLAKLEVEMRSVERDFVMLEETYSQDMLNLQLARAYLKPLLENGRVLKYLEKRHAEVLEQFQRIVTATSLGT
jgi:hypothetical protein